MKDIVLLLAFCSMFLFCPLTWMLGFALKSLPPDMQRWVMILSFGGVILFWIGVAILATIGFFSNLKNK